MVKEQIEINNTRMLTEQCYRRVNGEKIAKTKTSHIIDQITHEKYDRNLRKEYTMCTKQETKTIMIARFHMLETGTNYKGTLDAVCNECKVKDDENHRLNYCKRYQSFNLYSNTQKANIDDIYSDDIEILRPIIKQIEKVWNTGTGNGTMRS